MRMRLALTLSCALMLAAVPVLALGASGRTDPGPRPFAPVQGGPVASAPLVAQWAPDHVLVQFTPDGHQRASLPMPGEKAVGPVRTGLASLDAALTEVRVTGARVAFPGVADRAKARQLGTDRWYILDLAPGADVPVVAARLASDPHLADALPDLVAFPAIAPNDPLYDENWGHNNTAQLPGLDWGGTYAHILAGVGTPGFDANAQSAWNASQVFGDPSVVIAILDSGVDVGHPDLLQTTGYDFGDNDNDPDDNSASPGHGTACAGVAAAIANNALGAVGIAGGCTIMPLKVANSAGSLLFSSITNAIYYAADNGADVISMSFGAATTAYAPTDNAITYANSLGCTMLAATGNENAGQISYPAYNTFVIGVGAASPCGERKRSSSSNADVNPGVNTDPNGWTCDGERWWGSNYGSSTQDHRGAVDVIAPTILPTTDIQGSGGYAGGDYSNFFNGTSCATPYAAGVCALIKSANPGFSPAQVRAQLVNTAQDVESVESVAGWDRYTGYGMVDAATAVGAIVNPGTLAEFSADITAGCASLTVSFADESSGSNDTWLWNFGDGGSDAAQNPTHTYAAPGVYDVTLTVSGPEGSDTLTKVAYIAVDGPPAAAFTTSSQFIQAGQSIDFTDVSAGDPVAWAWDFGDGGAATEQNPSHVYATPGVYNVKLVATNDCGPDSVTVANAAIVTAPPAPTAAFNLASPGGCAPVPADFTDESTGLIDSWTWDFGDGATDSVPDPSHIYLAAGTYDVTLIVANSGGADTLTISAAVLVDGPAAAAFSASDSVVTTGATVTFTDQTVGDVTGWEWNFGDGESANAQSPSHQYAVAGVYDVTLIATNPCGADTLTLVDFVTVTDPAGPVAGFSAAPGAGCAPLEVVFTDESLNGVTAWEWDFGDGTGATQQSPVHTFTAPGSYDVSLIVTGAGGVDTLTVAEAVAVAAPIVAGFALSDTSGAVPLEVTFTDTSTGNPTSWWWDFGDATVDSVQNPVHFYAADGNYDVTLVVTNGCSADTLTLVAAVTVSGLSPVGNRVAARFGLDANFPNPFNPSTTLVYSLAQPGRARLEIYDVSGRRIATLVDSEKAAGRHEIVWRPQDLASGVYFSRLTVGRQTDTRRVTLLK